MTVRRKGVGLMCEILLNVFGNEKQHSLEDVWMTMPKKYKNKMQAKVVVIA